MIINQLVDEDFVNYKKPSMVIGFPHCTFKCEKESGIKCCQNSVLATQKPNEISIPFIVKRYLDNDITSAIVFAGLEPFEVQSFNNLLNLVKEFRKFTNDDIVIFTGYYKNEVEEYISELKNFSNIIIKFGRYIPNQDKHYDNVLGVNLASNNQYAERIS